MADYPAMIVSDNYIGPVSRRIRVTMVPRHSGHHPRRASGSGRITPHYSRSARRGGSRRAGLRAVPHGSVAAPPHHSVVGGTPASLFCDSPIGSSVLTIRVPDTPRTAGYRLRMVARDTTINGHFGLGSRRRHG
jgi:hypothetical protein